MAHVPLLVGLVRTKSTKRQYCPRDGTNISDQPTASRTHEMRGSVVLMRQKILHPKIYKIISAFALTRNPRLHDAKCIALYFTTVSQENEPWCPMAGNCFSHSLTFGRPRINVNDVKPKDIEINCRVCVIAAVQPVIAVPKIDVNVM